jgi:hypothetical protein
MRYILLLLLAGCASTPRPIFTAEGAPAYYVECRRSMTFCMDEAAKVCPGGFVPVDSHRAAMTGGAWTTQGGAVGSALSLDMTFRCR